MTDRILRRPEVEAITGLARSTIYDRVKAGRFPRPVTLGSRSVGWRQSDIENWLSALVAAGSAETPPRAGIGTLVGSLAQGRTYSVNR